MTCLDFLGVKWTNPAFFGFRPFLWRSLSRPPRATLTLAMIIPGFALYPKERALSSLVGFSVRVTVVSLRHCMRRSCHTLPRLAFGFFHASFMYLYIPMYIISCVFLRSALFAPHPGKICVLLFVTK